MTLFTLVRYWKWFLLSMVFCLSLAQLYISLSTPVYKVTGRMLVKRPERHVRSNRMLANISIPGTITNTSSAEEEMAKIWSTSLMGDVVKSLKLYTEYYVEDWPKKKLVYGRQPINVDLDSQHVDSINEIVHDKFCTINLKLSRKKTNDSVFTVHGVLLSDDEPKARFRRRIKSLPAFISTPFGTLTFTKNLNGDSLTAERDWMVNIVPVTYSVILNLNKLTVAQLSGTSEETYQSNGRFLIRKYLRNSGVVKLTLADRDVRRASDILKQIAVSYNRLATLEKHEIALRTEQFINDRLTRISEELDTSDTKVAGIVQKGQITSLADASYAVKGQNMFSTYMSDANAEIQMLNELEAYVVAPENRYAVIPSNIGLRDASSSDLIKRYNKTILERNRLLKSATEESPQIKLLTSTADELNSAIIKALQHAQQASSVNLDRMKSQYDKYKGVVSMIPGTEHDVMSEGRNQKIKTKLYLLLLQKREENSIILASTSANGELIDEPLCEGRIRPRLLLAYAIGLSVGILIPYALLLIMGFLRYKIRDHEDVLQLTDLPVLADIPLADKDQTAKAGIVVQADRNEMMDEVFRGLRTNLFFMLREKQNVILFTSSRSGEGKSFIAANLAVSYASLGKRVLLCGMDIRKPALHLLFGLSDRSLGITNLLRMDDVTKEDVFQQIQPSGIMDNLDLLLAGPVPPNPTELLARDNLTQIVGILKTSYDYVILDTAPVGLVTDPLLIGRLADLTVYICRTGFTERHEFCLVNQLSKEGKMPHLGIVINASQPDNSDKWIYHIKDRIRG